MLLRGGYLLIEASKTLASKLLAPADMLYAFFLLFFARLNTAVLLVGEKVLALLGDVIVRPLEQLHDHLGTVAEGVAVGIFLKREAT